MGKKRVSWFCYPRENRKKLLALCPVDKYRTFLPEELDGLLPPKLLHKAESVFVMASGTLNGDVIVMANVNRIDWDKGRVVIDQEPSGFCLSAHCDNENVQPSGCFVHHQKWEGRTTCQPELPEKQSGSIDELTIESQHKAFEKICSVLAQ